ncbi:hypothetical protein [Lactococcus lactis]
MSNYGQPKAFLDIFYTGITFWYSYRNDNALIAIGVNNSMTKGLNRQNNSYGKFVTLWGTCSNEAILLGKYGLLGISLSYLAAIFAVASLGASTATLKAIRGMLAFVGIPMADIVAVADAIILYKSDINKLKNTFVEAFNDDDRRP